MSENFYKNNGFGMCNITEREINFEVLGVPGLSKQNKVPTYFQLR